MVVGGNQSGKGAKGLLMGKGAAAAAAAAAAVDDKKDKKKPTSRSSRAGLQVCPL
jgi:histone H2A